MPRFTCKKLLAGEERVVERLVYFRFFGTKASDRSVDRVDGLLAELDDKRLEVNMHAAAKAKVSAQFKKPPI